MAFTVVQKSHENFRDEQFSAIVIELMDCLCVMVPSKCFFYFVLRC